MAYGDDMPVMLTSWLFIDLYITILRGGQLFTRILPKWAIFQPICFYYFPQRHRILVRGLFINQRYRGVPFSTLFMQ